MKSHLLFYLMIVGCRICGAATNQPNILWLVAEDANIKWFGCYGKPN